MPTDSGIKSCVNVFSLIKRLRLYYYAHSLHADVNASHKCKNGLGWNL